MRWCSVPGGCFLLFITLVWQLSRWAGGARESRALTCRRDRWSFINRRLKKKINRQRGRVVWRSAPRWNNTQQYQSLLFCYIWQCWITYWPFNQNAPWLLWKNKGTMAWLWPPGADGCHSTPSLQFYKRPRCGSLFGCLMCHLHRADGARQDVRRSNWQKGTWWFFFIFKIKNPHVGSPVMHHIKTP